MHIYLLQSHSFFYPFEKIAIIKLVHTYYSSDVLYTILLDDQVKSGSYMDRGMFRITYGYHSRTHLFLKKSKNYSYQMKIYDA